VTGVLGSRPSPVDLHLHTSASDGDDDPVALADRVAAAGVRVAAVTDHDTVAAVPAFTSAAAGRFAVVPGCEITATDAGAEAHLLGYWAEGPALRRRLAAVHDADLAWWRAWVARVEAFGVPLTWADVKAEVGRDRVARPAVYLDLLLRAAAGDPRFDGYAGDHRRLVADLCRPGGPLHVPPPWLPELTDAIGWVVDAGGAAVLAHACHEREVDADGLRALRRAGLAGVEVWTTWHTPGQSARLAGLCAEAGLLATAGSDHHGPDVKPWSPGPGLLPTDPEAPLSGVDALYERRGDHR
jgi:predicted metal-dependent phosphoesterase TrpH